MLGLVLDVVGPDRLGDWVWRSPGSEVRVVWDAEPTDRYGRDLVHLWTTDGTWVNGILLAEGHAR